MESEHISMVSTFSKEDDLRQKCTRRINKIKRINEMNDSVWSFFKSTFRQLERYKNKYGEAVMDLVLDTMDCFLFIENCCNKSQDNENFENTAYEVINYCSLLLSFKKSNPKYLSKVFEKWILLLDSKLISINLIEKTFIKAKSIIPLILDNIYLAGNYNTQYNGLCLLIKYLKSVNEITLNEIFEENIIPILIPSIKELLLNNPLKKGFLKSSRKFLNILNLKLSDEISVYSEETKSILIGDLPVKRIRYNRMKKKLQPLWIDFNAKTKSLSFYCDPKTFDVNSNDTDIAYFEMFVDKIECNGFSEINVSTNSDPIILPEKLKSLNKYELLNFRKLKLIFLNSKCYDIISKDIVEFMQFVHVDDIESISTTKIGFKNFKKFLTHEQLNKLDMFGAQNQKVQELLASESSDINSISSTLNKNDRPETSAATATVVISGSPTTYKNTKSNHSINTVPSVSATSNKVNSPNVLPSVDHHKNENNLLMKNTNKKSPTSLERRDVIIERPGSNCLVKLLRCDKRRISEGTNYRSRYKAANCNSNASTVSFKSYLKNNFDKGINKMCKEETSIEYNENKNKQSKPQENFNKKKKFSTSESSVNYDDMTLSSQRKNFQMKKQKNLQKHFEFRRSESDKSKSYNNLNPKTNTATNSKINENTKFDIVKANINFTKKDKLPKAIEVTENSSTASVATNRQKHRKNNSAIECYDTKNQSLRLVSLVKPLHKKQIHNESNMDSTNQEESEQNNNSISYIEDESYLIKTVDEYAKNHGLIGIKSALKEPQNINKFTASQREIIFKNCDYISKSAERTTKRFFKTDPEERNVYALSNILKNAPQTSKKHYKNINMKFNMLKLNKNTRNKNKSEINLPQSLPVEVGQSKKTSPLIKIPIKRKASVNEYYGEDTKKDQNEKTVNKRNKRSERKTSDMDISEKSKSPEVLTKQKQLPQSSPKEWIANVQHPDSNNEKIKDRELRNKILNRREESIEPTKSSSPIKRKQLESGDNLENNPINKEISLVQSSEPPLKNRKLNPLIGDNIIDLEEIQIKNAENELTIEDNLMNIDKSVIYAKFFESFSSGKEIEFPAIDMMTSPDRVRHVQETHNKIESPPIQLTYNINENFKVIKDQQTKELSGYFNFSNNNNNNCEEENWINYSISSKSTAFDKNKDLHLKAKKSKDEILEKCPSNLEIIQMKTVRVNNQDTYKSECFQRLSKSNYNNNNSIEESSLEHNLSDYDPVQEYNSKVEEYRKNLFDKFFNITRASEIDNAKSEVIQIFSEAYDYLQEITEIHDNIVEHRKIIKTKINELSDTVDKSSDLVRQGIRQLQLLINSNDNEAVTNSTSFAKINDKLKKYSKNLEQELWQKLLADFLNKFKVIIQNNLLLNTNEEK